MQYVKILSTGKIAEVRMQLRDHLVIRYQDGTTEKILRRLVEPLDLVDA